MEQLFGSVSKMDCDGATFRLIEQNVLSRSNFPPHRAKWIVMEPLSASSSKMDCDGAIFRLIEQIELSWSNFSAH